MVEGLWPVDVARMYGIDPDGDARGQCIGILALGGGYRTDDVIAAAEAQGGRPVPLIVDCSVDGAQNAFSGGTEADAEIALDLQIVASLVPSGRVAVYFATDRTARLADAIRKVVRDEVNRPTVLSISWGSAELFWEDEVQSAMADALAEAARAGISVVAAAGDELATAGLQDGAAHVLFPASSPVVLACGGTQLAGDHETVWHEGWSGTGGGMSDVFERPAYQQGISFPRRGVPDVAGLAAPYRIVLDGAVHATQGTSAAAPLWASILAMANAKRGIPAGAIHKYLYANPWLCRPITEGNNRIDGIGFDAGPDWNACTGLGVPNPRTVDGLAAMPLLDELERTNGT